MLSGIEDQFTVGALALPIDGRETTMGDISPATLELAPPATEEEARERAVEEALQIARRR